MWTTEDMTGGGVGADAKVKLRIKLFSCHARGGRLQPKEQRGMKRGQMAQREEEREVQVTGNE